MDPIKYGTAVFKQLADEFGGEKLTELGRIEEFFARLIAETRGLVILDFLDTSNWDRIESFKVDHNTHGSLILEAASKNRPLRAAICCSQA